MSFGTSFNISPLQIQLRHTFGTKDFPVTEYTALEHWTAQMKIFCMNYLHTTILLLGSDKRPYITTI